MSLSERPANAVVGQPEPHESADVHVTGHALYTDDLGNRYANLLPNKSINIRVANLGVQSPRLALEGRFQFDIVTSYPGRQTVIQASENLLDWVPISTNQPSSNTFTFTDSSPATNSHRFYRVRVPPE